MVQVKKGLGKLRKQTRMKVALLKKDVTAMIKYVAEEEPVLAGLIAVARLFLLRVPSEAIPLEWAGAHSTVVLEEDKATIVLAKRKNRATPTRLERKCCCATSGAFLCGVQWLHRIKLLREDESKVFGLKLHYVRRRLKEVANSVEVKNASQVGAHSLRRGMAQDIIDSGNSLAVLLKAGGWSSGAFLDYLRADQASDAAVSQVLVQLSDSDEDV